VGVVLPLGKFDLLINNILIDGHKNIMFLTLVSQFITIIEKALELVFIHFYPS